MQATFKRAFLKKFKINVSNVVLSLDGLEKIGNAGEGLFIGAGLGAFAGLIIGEGRKKRFTVNGDRQKFLSITFQ